MKHRHTMNGDHMPNARFPSPGEAVCIRHLLFAAVALAIITAPTTVRADLDEPSAAIDRELVVEEKPPVPKVAPDLLTLPGKGGALGDLSLDLGTDYGVDDKALAATVRATFTFNRWAGLQLAAAGEQRGFDDDGLTGGQVSAGVMHKFTSQLHGRVTARLKIGERMDAAAMEAMETSIASTAGIDGEGKLKLLGGRSVTKGRLGVRFSDSTTGLGVLSEAVKITKAFTVAVALTTTLASGTPTFEAEFSVALERGPFEFGLTASTPLDNLATVIGISMSYTFKD